MRSNSAISDPPSAPVSSRTRGPAVGAPESVEERSQQTATAAPATLNAQSPAPAVLRRTGWLVMWLVLAAVLGGGWYTRDSWWPRVATLVSRPPQPKPPVRPVPVGTAKVREQNISLYLNGLGTVTPLKTVTVRSRLEGELVTVAFEEGQVVQEGDLLAEIDQRPYEIQRDQAAGQLARDEASLAAAKLTLSRYEQLAKGKVIPVQQLQDQVAVVQQLEGSVKTDRAMIDNAELQIAYCRITAPVSGRIGLRLVDLGNYVRANDANGLAIINQIRPITVVFTISQDDIPRVQKRIRAGQELRVDVYDRELTNRLAQGTLLATDNQVDSTTGTLRLKAIVEDGAEQLFPNQFVNTRLLVEELPSATTVPASAVQRGPQGTFVYVVTAEELAEVRLISVGETEAGDTIIEQGLAVGETVVTDGIDKLQPGAKVALRQPGAEGRAPFEGKPVGDTTGSQGHP